MQKLEGKTFNVIEDNIQKLKGIFPEVFTEDKVDIDKLRLVLGENVEIGKERYEFTWNGKTEAIKLAQKQATGTLRTCKEESVNWETAQNLFIEGDNLEVLRALQAAFRNKVKVIYIDPPYNTGRDFVYKDDFHDNVKSYKLKNVESMKSNPETSGRYHTDWLNMIYPRLKLARNFLREDGVIYISIDDNELHNLRKVCDEIFGENNFLGNIVRATGQTTGQDSGGLGSSFDFVLAYSKNPDVSLSGLPLTEHDLKRFDNEDARGKYAYDQMRKTGSNDRREDRPNMYYPVIDPDGNEVYPIASAGYEGCWRFEQKTYKKLLDEGFILWKKTKRQDKEIWWPYVKYYLEGRTKRPSPLWTDLDGNKKASRDLRNLFGGKKVFDHPKPLDFIKRLIQIAPNANSNDIILDFFAGSATTAHAVLELNSSDGGNRRFITIQIPQNTEESTEAYKAGFKNISELSKERLRLAGKKIIEDNIDRQDIKKLDIGFKVFKLDDTNLKVWDEEPLDIEKNLLDLVETVKEGRSQEDVVYEVLLKYGIDLSIPIDMLDIVGKTVYSVGMGYLLVCLEKDLTLEQIEEMAKQQPVRIVFYDEGFKDDTVRTNAQQILKRYGVEDIRVI
ncbi:site-specific DNA-methyltransferase [Bacillus wiedmannii]|uniref:site-specific DNA-methyltransferase n=1 Tax=Bacillus wiedmannii TaxID=1890302 RepID=UPI0007DB2A23|nr:site-specific DNA-methyltransferase [Bacillus wiedmannii]OAK46940.1 DNA methylase N-4 [Bacillus wiedmannii]HDR7661446.1 site-specific DNA-methyltransferase [Bacillus wiedmannii]